MHHFAHAQNTLVSGDPIARLDARTMASLNRRVTK
jgi:hypothetical protein